MNYYLDQEFHEYFKKPISWLPTIGKFNKPYHTIELISIGIVAEDGREYYAVCNEFNLKAAEKNPWLNENVLTPIEANFYQKESGYAKYHHSESLTLKNFLKWKGKTKEQIKYEINHFLCDYTTASDYAGVGSLDSGFSAYLKMNPPVFYGYYADYDWVLFCSLYGTMMDLPKGFPMFCHDLKQIMQHNAIVIRDKMLEEQKDNEVLNFNPDLNAVEKSFIKDRIDYPKHKNEHHALADAKWNKELHDFLKSF